ncbi:MAG: restriction endonuclease [Pelagimonas sp.]|nr:restriction endonuclease [Pelagimonas sp.]
MTLDNSYLEQFAEFQDFRSRTKSDEISRTKAPSSEKETNTPDEDLQFAHKRLENALAATLLDNTRRSNPAFFEHLIIDLFLAMGYGGSFEGAGRALGQSGDNGVDGVIDQDPLGLDQIYLQAKRYQANNSVGPSEIRDFFGALSLKKASKGIFVTTSYFTDAAKQTARDLGSRIVLIDGLELSQLMVKYGIGCESKEVLYIKALDDSYFDLD